ncbi:MAG: hypothetical protein EPO23_00225 [Xanthobacteraceae bacterium]|nr:MAG: hypothetical protein EPO23_00225 [Xanthobacteraceae bacterium]
MRHFSCAGALRAAFAVVAVFAIMGTGAAFAACDPEVCGPGTTTRMPAPGVAAGADEEPMPIVRTKRKVRNAHARYSRTHSRARSEARDSAAGIKEGADRNTPVIDFRAPTTPAPGARIAPPAASPAPMKALAAGAGAAATSSAINAMASADTATAAAPAQPPAAAPQETSASVTPAPDAAPATAAAPQDASAPTFWHTVQAGAANLYASLNSFFGESATAAPADKEASLMGRIFVGLAGLLTVASALRFAIF